MVQFSSAMIYICFSTRAGFNGAQLRTPQHYLLPVRIQYGVHDFVASKKARFSTLTKTGRDLHLTFESCNVLHSDKIVYAFRQPYMWQARLQSYFKVCIKDSLVCNPYIWIISLIDGSLCFQSSLSLQAKGKTHWAHLVPLFRMKFPF